MKGFYYEASKPRNAAFSPSVTSLLAVGIRKYALLHHYLTALCLISISSVWWWNKFLLVWFYRVSHLISVSTYLNNYIYSFLFLSVFLLFKFRFWNLPSKWWGSSIWHADLFCHNFVGLASLIIDYYKKAKPCSNYITFRWPTAKRM